MTEANSEMPTLTPNPDLSDADAFACSVCEGKIAKAEIEEKGQKNAKGLWFVCSKCGTTCLLAHAGGGMEELKDPESGEEEASAGEADAESEAEG